MRKNDKVSSVSPKLSHRRNSTLSAVSGRGSLYQLQLPNNTLTATSPPPSKKATNLTAYLKIFRFATTLERLGVALGVILAILMGLCIPIGLIAYGEFTMLLLDRVDPVGPTSPSFIISLFGGGRIIVNGTSDELKEALIEDSAAFGISAAVITSIQLIVGIISIDLLNITAMKQIERIRFLLLKSILRQEMSYYDLNTNVNFATKVSDDLDKIKDGISEKIAIFIFLISSFVFSVITSFIYGWKLTLVVLSSAPVIIVATAVVAKVQSSLTEKELKSYNIAGVIAEEVLSSIRTVVAFGGERKEVDRYTENLKTAKLTGYRKGLFSGLGLGIEWFIIYVSYAIAFYYGVSLIIEERGNESPEYTVAVLMIVFFGVLQASQNLGLTSPHLEAFTAAEASATNVFSIIDRVSLIDSLSTEGKKPSISGQVKFNNVFFHYPSRPQLKILKGLNLEIKPGKIVAFVGTSGCGKSTCLQLIQRLYDTTNGTISIDNHDVKSLNVNWLRNQIGVVGQEPILFGTTIENNIRYGNPDCNYNDIESAAKAANCHDFISKLPSGYKTMVGERGAQLSGGQKQRIAIARALVRNPKILLLDEATSALDLQSEAKVQKALDIASKGRTTIIVTHRLSTIRNCDMIYYMDSGTVVEMGTHNELLELKSYYYKLVTSNLQSENDCEKETTDLTGTTEKVEVDSVSSESENFDVTKKSVGQNDEEIIEESNLSSWKIMKLNAPEWHFILIGSIASFILGGTLPAFAIIFGDIYGVLSMDDSDEVLSTTLKYCMYYLVIGVISGLGTFVQIYLFNVSGSRMTARLRSDTFSAMLKQEMAWYDDSKNSVGALGIRLAGDCGAVQGATGTKVGAILQATSALVIGIIISLFYSWQMTMVAMTMIPIILGSVYMEERLMGGEGVEEKLAMESSSKIATEAMANIKTVASLCQEKGVLERFAEEIKNISKSVRKKSRYRGCVFSLGQSTPYFGYAISLYYGGLLVARDEMQYQDVIKVSECLIFGSWMIGQALAYAPNFNSAKVSAHRLFQLLERIPKIVSPSDTKVSEEWETNGDIEYKRVSFCYPMRPEIQILDDLSLQISKGQTVALVGHSGCGKSTCIQLLQRLYDTDKGSVLLDKFNIKEDMTLSKLRCQLGIVSQEPVLFDKTITENIAYGDNSRIVSMDEIIKAATDANIHGFIKTLPLGYETKLGPKGTQLSGGQKQRIAIARALIRNPHILLLDEATSALDTHSEKIVQEALDKASEGRTCIIIAHRLATIRNADVILVLDKGQVVESGSHDQLIKLGGHYAQLYSLQNFTEN